MRSKGVTFNHVTMDQAKTYLERKNSDFRIKAYCKNYEVKPSTGEYINLDFNYLTEMAEIDHQLRRFITKFIVHLEHILKQNLLRDLTNEPTEDGFTIISDFLVENPGVLSSIEEKRRQSVVGELIDKYRDRYSMWSILEVLSFGEFIKLYGFYYERHPAKGKHENILHHIKFLRNAVVHNICLLNSLKRPYQLSSFRRCEEVVSYLSRSPISSKARNKNLENPVIHDLITALYVFQSVCADRDTKKKYCVELNRLFKADFVKNGAYFNGNSIIQSRYEFFIKFIDYYSTTSYN